MNIIDFSNYSICRICEGANPVTNICDSISVLNRLRACSNIAIDEEDQLPKLICEKCEANLEFAYHFKIQCEFTDRKFRRLIARAWDLKNSKNKNTLKKSLSDQFNFNIEYVDCEQNSYLDTIPNDDNVEDVFLNYEMEVDIKKSEQNEIQSEDDFIVEYLEDDIIEETLETLSSKTLKLEVSDEYQTYLPTAITVEHANMHYDSNSILIEHDYTNLEKEFDLEDIDAIEEEDEAIEKNKKNSDLFKKEKSNNNNKFKCKYCSKWLRRSYIQKHLYKHKKELIKFLEEDPTELKKPTKANDRTESLNKTEPNNELEGKDVKSTEESDPISNTINENKTTVRKRAKCEYCLKWFLKSSIRLHVKTMHINKTRYYCKLCDKSYGHAQNLDRHIRVFHKKIKPYECGKCCQKFSQRWLLAQHQFAHAIERPFECNICNKFFKSKNSLALHQNTHSIKNDPNSNKPSIQTNRTFKLCSYCGKVFTNSQIHMRIHTGEKPFECNICKKTFTFSTSLKTHSLVHSGEKPFKCKECGMSFRQKHHLNFHQLTHTGEKPHNCLICNKAFALQGNLTVHIRKHTGETPYHCTMCPKKFIDINGLKRHKRTHK